MLIYLYLYVYVCVCVCRRVVLPSWQFSDVAKKRILAQNDDSIILAACALPHLVNATLVGFPNGYGNTCRSGGGRLRSIRKLGNRTLIMAASFLMDLGM